MGVSAEECPSVAGVAKYNFEDGVGRANLPYDGEQMFVSAWEMHPSAEAQRIFGEEIAAAIAGMEAIRPYRREEESAAAEGAR